LKPLYRGKFTFGISGSVNNRLENPEIVNNVAMLLVFINCRLFIYTSQKLK
jgi:hypothetical protein